MGDKAGKEAATRAEELLRRGRELADRKPVTAADARRASERAEHAHARDQDARDRELQRQYEAAAAHERAAEVHELAVKEGLGDVAAHRRAAEKERESARRDYQKAQEADRQQA
ncbi:hypothetical protein [Mycobacterium sp. 94-17]|uniref:hypothetical protein n=1 Tax=Mycobacterium sp. 94-17 TaxID=2986147 RepID=UPI002D1F0912|nr:hypothetical protein [Mycobacterium sp. 94-17]MEB4208623.1 hypothetical protein [Mycobacterium sp. 94-17]